MAQVGHLNELHEKYFDRGLRVIAISAEPMGTIQSKMGEAKYWIGSDPDGATQSRFLTGRGGGIPHAYLVDAMGTIVADVHPGNLRAEQIEGLLQGAFDERLGRELHPSLRAAARSYERRDYGKAFAAAERYLESEDRDQKADAEYLRERCLACAEFRKKLVEQGTVAKDYGTVHDDLEDIAKEFAGMEVAAWAKAEAKRLDADPAVAEEVKAWKLYEKAVEKERRAEGKAKKLGPAKSAYKSIVRKYPETRAGKLAGEALARLPE